MDQNELEKLATVLKANEGSIVEGSKKVCLTAHVLDKVNYLVNLHIKQSMINNPTCIDLNNRSPIDTIRDVQLIYKLIQNTVQLKLIKDVVDVENTVDVSEFKRLKSLEIEKVEIQNLTGINQLRLHLQQLICVRSIESLKSLLEDCGADYSSKYVWNELKKLNLSYNKLTTLDSSLDSVPWLHTLDISHNELVNVNEITCLTNLKYLNLSFNKLQRLPQFSGQICNRLQILNASNNFIEDLTELHILNLSELDISNNCLVDHKTLVSLSHMATLQWLSLKDNPFSFHIHHNHNTCSYLHSNIDPYRFILDYKPLRKSEIKLIGTFRPLHHKFTSNEGYSTSGTDGKLIASTEKIKRVRNVLIEDSKSNEKQSPSLINSCSSVDHLEVKKHIQQLREEYGESWLNYYNGPSIEDETSESMINSLEISNYLTPDETTNGGSPKSTLNETDVVIEKLSEIDTNREESVYADDEFSDDEDIDVGGEESLYLAKVEGEIDGVFIVLTNTVISERECTTSKERAQWIIDTIIACEYTDETRISIQIDFDTLRKDRKRRIYVFQNEDGERFFETVNKIISSRSIKVSNKMFQCMKCLSRFPKVAAHEVMVDCPNCGSGIIVEETVKQN